MNLLAGATAIGCILALLGLGVFLSYRILNTLDLTTDGAFGIGAAVVATLLGSGTPPLLATIAASLAGALAGAITGLLHTRLFVNALLAGVLTSTALYSISLWAMGSGNLGLPGTHALELGPGRLALVACVAAVLLGAFLGSDLGLALRAAGANPPMARAQGIDVDRMQVLGLALANTMVALSGALLVQHEGFASIDMGVGAIVTGLGGVLVGETLLGRRSMARGIAGVLLGAVVLRLAVAAAIRAGLHPIALKLVTALLVLAVLALPHLSQTLRARLRHA
jgi:putative ABC transport system permease protein